MRIGIDARAAGEVPAGRGRVVRELLRTLAERDDPHEFVLYTRRPWQELGERFCWRPLALPDPWWHVRAGLAANRECDAFLSTNSYLTPWFLRIPTALMVYDLVAFQPGAPARKSSFVIERATTRCGLARSAAAICISEATRLDLLERYPRIAGRAVTVPLAADADFGRARSADELERVRARYSLPADFVLTVGTLEPRKNLARLLAAHKTLPQRERFPLAVVGPTGWDTGELVERMRAATHVAVLGHVPDADLAALYQSCTVFCYPSLYEGFGLPLLEAMTAGATCITSNVSSLPEVGGDAVRYVDPLSVEELTAALAQLLDSPDARAVLRERARARAGQFSWSRTTGEILTVLEAVAARGAVAGRS